MYGTGHCATNESDGTIMWNNIYAAGLGMKAGAGIMSGFIANDEAKASAGFHEYNAMTYEQNVKAVEKKTLFDLQRWSQTGTRIMSELRSKLAMGGAVLDVGAPLLVLSEQAEEIELEKDLIAHAGAVEAGQWRSQKVLSLMRAKYAKQKGKSAMISSFANVGATLLTGFATMNAMGMFNEPTSGNASNSFSSNTVDVHPDNYRGIGLVPEY